MSSFKDLRIVDNFYQTSAFFPMPTTLIGTLAEDGKTTGFGAYSLVFPYYIAGKDYYAMVLECRNSSNTCKGILRHKKCTINFIPDDRKFFREAVRLGFPGDTPEEKMKDCRFTVEDGLMAAEHPDKVFPKVIGESFQVFECSWVDTLDNAQDDVVREEYLPPYHDFNGITSPFGAHFILKIDKILMKERYYNAIVNGVKAGAFPPVPVDYGYRDSTNFWYTPFRRPKAEPIPNREVDMDSIRYAANRADDVVKFADDALLTIVKVPRAFLSLVLKGCVKWAKENGVTLITAEHMKTINDKRAAEKKK